MNMNIALTMITLPHHPRQ